jgi:prepilin signal peptidase PulO-like enzyme (type II secretory pathway)
LPSLEPRSEPAAGSIVGDSPQTGARTWRQPVVTGLAGLLAALCLVRYDAEAHGFISAFTVAVLVVLAATDLQERLIPNRIVLPAAALVLVAQLAFYSDRAAEWILSALGAALFLFIPAVIKRGAIGMGDVKLALLLGASLGFAVLPALTLGFLSLVPVALYMLIREGAAARKKYLPLGPFLAFGTLVVLLAGGAA